MSPPTMAHRLAAEFIGTYGNGGNVGGLAAEVGTDGTPSTNGTP